MAQLTDSQRYNIDAMYRAGSSQIEIANHIGKDKSVICRELKRNRDERNQDYRADLAIRKCRNRHSTKAKFCRFTAEIRMLVDQKLKNKWSPEQISGTLSKQGIEMVSPERIYQHVWSDKKQKGKLYLNLRNQGKRYRKRGANKDNRGIIRNRIDISERPASVDLRESFGDLEIDTIIGKDNKGAIVTINDRATGVLKMVKLEGKNALELANQVINTLTPWKPLLRTITSDNGKEFAEHQFIAATLNIDFYFAKPYHSWERGSNENLNGLIRQYIPKQTDLKSISNEFVQFVEEELNNRPRKRFDFKTPREILNKVAFIT